MYSHVIHPYGSIHLCLRYGVGMLVYLTKRRAKTSKNRRIIVLNFSQLRITGQPKLPQFLGNKPLSLQPQTCPLCRPPPLVKGWLSSACLGIRLGGRTGECDEMSRASRRLARSHCTGPFYKGTLKFSAGLMYTTQIVYFTYLIFNYCNWDIYTSHRLGTIESTHSKTS